MAETGTSIMNDENDVFSGMVLGPKINSYWRFDIKFAICRY